MEVILLDSHIESSSNSYSYNEPPLDHYAIADDIESLTPVERMTFIFHIVSTKDNSCMLPIGIVGLHNGADITKFSSDFESYAQYFWNTRDRLAPSDVRFRGDNLRIELTRYEGKLFVRWEDVRSNGRSCSSSLIRISLNPSRKYYLTGKVTRDKTIFLNPLTFRIYNEIDRCVSPIMECIICFREGRKFKTCTVCGHVICVKCFFRMYHEYRDLKNDMVTCSLCNEYYPIQEWKNIKKRDGACPFLQYKEHDCKPIKPKETDFAMVLWPCGCVITCSAIQEEYEYHKDKDLGKFQANLITRMDTCPYDGIKIDSMTKVFVRWKESEDNIPVLI